LFKGSGKVGVAKDDIRSGVVDEVHVVVTFLQQHFIHMLNDAPSPITIKDVRPWP